DVLEYLREMFGVAGDDVFGTGGIGAFQETVSGSSFLISSMLRVGWTNSAVSRISAREASMCVGSNFKRGRWSTSSYSASTAAETNIRIFLSIAKLKMAADGPSSTRLAETTTLVSMTTRIIAWAA